MSTRTDSNSSNEEEATEVVSVMSPTSASLEPGLKGVSSEKKGKGPKILQKLWQRKGTQLGSSPALATLTLSSTTTTNTTSTSQGRMISQSQQELPPPMSPGKNRKRILFRHSQTPQTTNGGGVATPSHSLFTSSSSSVTVSSSSPTPFSSSSSPKIPCGYECGILRLGVLTVKSKYLFFEEDTALYNTLSSSGSQDEEGEGASNPTIAANSVIGSDMFPLKIPIPTIIGVSKVVNDYSYEINLYTSNGTIHTIVFEDSSNYTNAYTQIEHAMTHKKHLNFNLLRRSSKNQHPLDYEQQQQQQQQQQVQQVQEQQKLSPTQKPEQKEIERVEGEQESVYGSPTRAGDRSYESDEDVLESHTHKKRKKHKRRKERKHTREECEALGFVCDDRCEEKGTDTHDNCGTASPPQNICEAAKDSLALHSTEPDSSESEVGGAKQNRSCGTPTKTPLICASATAASTPISCEGKKDKGEEKIVVNNSNNNGSNGDSQEYSTNAIFFVLGIIFTLLAQRIF